MKKTNLTRIMLDRQSKTMGEIVRRLDKTLNPNIPAKEVEHQDKTVQSRKDESKHSEKLRLLFN